MEPEDSTSSSSESKAIKGVSRYKCLRGSASVAFLWHIWNGIRTERIPNTLTHIEGRTFEEHPLCVEMSQGLDT